MRHPRPTKQQANHTSWEPVAKWYGAYLQSRSTFQRDIVFPGALRLLDPRRDGNYLDIACGQGSFAHLLAKRSKWVTGFDASPSLIEQAKKHTAKNETFFTEDAAHFVHHFPEPFDGATCILAIQNIETVEPTFRDAASVLKPKAPFVLVMNHPAFRQPSQSGWGWDEKRKLQYRRVDRYLSEFKAPILAHPGSNRSVKTHSFHRPLQSYVKALTENGFIIDALEEWISNKKSDSGPRAKAENMAREEIPMFLAMRSRKS